MIKKKPTSPKTKKALILSGLSIILAGIIVAMVFLGIFLYERYTPNVRFANANENWEQAQKKKAYDEIVIDFCLGHDDNTLDLLLNIEGQRNYDKESVFAEYDIELIFYGFGLNRELISLRAEIEITPEGNHIIVNESDETENLIDFSGFEANFSQQETQDIGIDLDSIIFYNTQKMSIAKDNSFYIEGNNSVKDIISIISLLLNEYVDIDIWTLLENKANFTRVSGDIYYDKAFIANKIKSSQNISFYMPWVELDAIVEDNSDQIPSNILEIYDSKKIEVEFLGSPISIDLLDYLPEGILANLRIITETRYEILE